MPERLIIRSHKGEYTVAFDNDLLRNPGQLLEDEPHFIVDKNVARIYREPLRPILEHPRTILVEATEENKSIERIIGVIRQLVDNRIRRDHRLVAVGGGIIQDIACFIASTLLRGLEWRYVPTTLLSQADSCIGSKSSINLGPVKNILGTFNPPGQIVICANFLDSLEEKDIRSGIGEIIKVHAIDSAASFDQMARDFDTLLADRTVLLKYIHKALEIKKRFIEVDEFDRGVRNIFNYGHSFGHAMESATDFAIPHGIAVTIGMDMANHVAWQRRLLPEAHYRRMKPLLSRNYSPFARTPIPLEPMLAALSKDKKNTSGKLVLILPVGDDARLQRTKVDNDIAIREQCKNFLMELQH